MEIKTSLIPSHGVLLPPPDTLRDIHLASRCLGGRHSPVTPTALGHPLPHAWGRTQDGIGGTQPLLRLPEEARKLKDIFQTPSQWDLDPIRYAPWRLEC